MSSDTYIPGVSPEPVEHPPLPHVEVGHEQPVNEALAAEATPAVKPAGSPDLWPFMSLPRRQRARFLGLIGPILSHADDLDGIRKSLQEQEGKDADPQEAFRHAEVAYNLAADIEDALALTAAPGQDFAGWARTASDDDLMGLLNWYMETFQPGEANASPT